jgi:hypothetical protein
MVYLWLTWVSFQNTKPVMLTARIINFWTSSGEFKVVIVRILLKLKTSGFFHKSYAKS